MDKLKTWKKSNHFRRISGLCFPLLLLFLGCCTVFSQSSPVVSGSGFNVYFEQGKSLAFQHVEKPYAVLPLTIQVTVASGLLNGTSGSLTMYENSGLFTFINQNTTTLSLTSSKAGTYLTCNGAHYEAPVSLSAGQSVRIEWSIRGWNPVLAIMGLVGIVMLVVSPTYSIYQVKVKKEYAWVFWCIVLIAIGYGLLMGWLQS